ncbi:hypothetical protein FOC4_g10000811, partial [Fusarium odoratissimum]
VDALFWCSIAICDMVSLATASADWLSTAVAGKVVVLACFALFRLDGFVYKSGCTAAKEGPESLGGLKKGHKELSPSMYINGLKPCLDFYLIADNTVTIHLIAAKVS